MNEEYYAIAPQMRDHHAAKHVYAPYVMQSNVPNYSSPYLSTDKYGFRTTIYEGSPLMLQRYHAPVFDGRRAALVGNSTSFGVGATDDQHTIASLLNKHTDLIWFNFSGRTYHTAQELITFILFAMPQVEHIVILSGINNFDLSYRWISEFNVNLPPFYSQAIYLDALSAYFDPKSPGLLRRVKRVLLRYLRRGKSAVSAANAHNTFFPQTTRERMSHRQELDALLQDPASLSRSLQRFERDMRWWHILAAGMASRATFILQPIPEWTHKPYSPEEVQLFKHVAAQRGEVWAKISAFLHDKGDDYRRAVKRICEQQGLCFYDANEFPFFKDDQWAFLDRYHLTDRAQALMAQFIAEEIIGRPA